MKSVSESLAGRADIVELETLSWAEIRGALPQNGLEAAIVRVGFPELHANPDIDHVAFYNSYLATYLERDVRSLANVGNLRDFERFLRACALRSANLVNKADLARDVAIAPSTANHWLSTLEASGQVLLEPWFSDRTKSIVKSPKLYLADTGVLCALLNIRSEEVLRQSPPAGAIWETFVFAQLRGRERRAGRSGSLFFWRDRTREVDFVVDVGGRLELLEAKWTELPTESDAVNLDFVRKVVGKPSVASAAIVCRTPNAATHDGRSLRLLTLLDGYTRECLAIRVARRLGSQEVIETLAEAMVWRGSQSTCARTTARSSSAKSCESGWQVWGRNTLHPAGKSLGKWLL
jgi:hypothetical protein